MLQSVQKYAYVGTYTIHQDILKEIKDMLLYWWEGCPVRTIVNRDRTVQAILVTDGQEKHELDRTYGDVLVYIGTTVHRYHVIWYINNEGDNVGRTVWRYNASGSKELVWES